MTCALKLLFISGVLVNAKYQIDLAHDKGSVMQILYLEKKLEDQRIKAEKICNDRGKI